MEMFVLFNVTFTLLALYINKPIDNGCFYFNANKIYTHLYVLCVRYLNDIDPPNSG